MTFIAPFNLLNNGTSKAVSRNGMAIISADEKVDHPAIEAVQKIYHLPVNANVSDYDEEQLYWKAFENKMVLSDAKKGLERDGYAMVMMHPRDFVDKDHKVDPAKLDQLKELIDAFHSQGVRIVTISEMASTATDTTTTTTTQTTSEFPLTIIVGAISVAASLMFYARSRIKRRLSRENGQ